MATLIDTSVLIDAEQGEISLDELLARFEDERFAVSAITATEMLYGFHIARGTAHRRRRGAYVEGVLERLPTLPFDLAAARIHSELAVRMDRKGARIGTYDAMIAATALANGYRLATRDLRSFPRIPELTTLLL